MLCYFLLYNEVNQLYIYIDIYIPFLLGLSHPPPYHPFRSSQSTELRFPSFIASSHYNICMIAVQSLSHALSDPMDCSMPDFPVLHHLPDLAQTHVHWVSDDIQPSYPLLSPSPPCLQSFPVSGSFLIIQLFASCGQSIGASASASASVLPMNIQGWFPLGLTGLISLQSKGLSRVFSNTIVQKHKLFGTQLF